MRLTTRMTEAQRESFMVACKPLMAWMRENMHPHSKAIVESEDAELLEGMIGISIAKEA